MSDRPTNRPPQGRTRGKLGKLRGPILGFLLLFSLGRPSESRAADPGAEVLSDLLTAIPQFSTGSPGNPASQPWWTTLGDPALEALMQRAFSHNGDLLASWARLDQTRARTFTATAPLLPVVSFDLQGAGAPRESLGFQFGLGSSSRSSAASAAGTTGTTGTTGAPAATEEEDLGDVYYNGSAKFNANWNLDVWGRQTEALLASTHDRAASEGDRDAAAIALATNVASAWYDLVHAEARKRLLIRQVDINRKMLELVQLRYEGGQSTGLDVLQQQQQLAGAESLLPAADRGVARGLARLALVLGENPSEIANQLSPGDDFPAIPASPPVGTPRDLLRNRPELVSAAAQVDAARSRRRVADRALLPTVGLNANAGWQGNDISGDWESQDVWGFGGSVSVPLFAGGRNIAGIADAHAGYVAAEATARQKALLAVQEVEDALFAEAQANAEVEALHRQVTFARLAFEDARERYVGGLVNYTTVLQAIMTLQTAELNHLAARRNQLAARIQLHDALGGVWPSSLVRPAGPSL